MARVEFIIPDDYYYNIDYHNKRVRVIDNLRFFLEDHKLALFHCNDITKVITNYEAIEELEDEREKKNSITFQKISKKAREMNGIKYHNYFFINAEEELIIQLKLML